MKYRKLADLQKDVETLDGKWELSPTHEVTYSEKRPALVPMHKYDAVTSQGLPCTASIKGSLVAAEPDALVISVTTKEDSDPNPQRIGTDSARAGRSRSIRRTVTGLVKLSGKWELDEKNRITFSVKRGLDRYDKLTFQGAWAINDNFQVTYSFSTQQILEGSRKKRRRVTRTTQELVFEGHWDISEKNRLTYLIGVDSESSFRFRGTFETSSILAKKGEIRYQVVPIPINWSGAEIGATLAAVKEKKTKASVGVECKTSRGVKKRLTQTITLFGKWKLSDDLALSFELECADGRRSEIKVGADISLKKLQGPGIRRLLPDEISVDLTSSEGDPLGVELVLTKDLFNGNARSFVRFRDSLKETAVEAGIKIPW